MQPSPLLWKGACKLTGLSPSLCMKGLHELVPNIGNVTNSTKESCYWPGDFPSYPGEPCCPYVIMTKIQGLLHICSLGTGHSGLFPAVIFFDVNLLLLS